MNWIIGACLAFLIVCLSFRLKLLTAGGTVTAFCVGCLLFGLGGLAFSLPLFIFFLTSSCLSSFTFKRKSDTKEITKKSNQRDSIQVLANSLIPLLTLLFWSVTGAQYWIWMYLVAVAVATADTWGTEIGLCSPHPPRSILNFRKVEAGTSGGVSFTGTLAAALGALLLTSSGLLIFSASDYLTFSIAALVVITVFGFLGQVLDSVLGASLQARFYCRNCGLSTEAERHCGQNTILHSGVGWLDNDAVNLISASVATFVSWPVVALVLAKGKA